MKKISKKTVVILVAIITIVVIAITVLVAQKNNSDNQDLANCTKSEMSLRERNDCLAAAVLARIKQNNNQPRAVMPQIDREVNAGNVDLLALCHIAMHKTGRDFARQQGLTLATIQNYLPPSDSPACSAGFTHGMMTALNVTDRSGQELLAICAREISRARQISCAHGIGHAFSRSQKNQNLDRNLHSCRRLGSIAGPECAAGVYHDYFIAVAGLDSTAIPSDVIDAGVICANKRRLFAEVCWFRQFQGLSLANQPAVQAQGGLNTGPDLVRACLLWTDDQLDPCITAASAYALRASNIVSRCRQLKTSQAEACLRGGRFIVPSFATNRRQAESLIKMRNRAYGRGIKQCSKINNKLRRICIHEIAFRSIRELPNNPPEAAAFSICHGLNRNETKICRSGIIEAQRRRL